MNLYKINGKWLNIGKIADTIGISRPTIYSWLNRGMNLQEIINTYKEDMIIEDISIQQRKETEKTKINNALKLIDNYIDNWKDGFELTDLIEIRKALKKDER